MTEIEIVPTKTDFVYIATAPEYEALRKLTFVSVEQSTNLIVLDKLVLYTVLTMHIYHTLMEMVRLILQNKYTATQKPVSEEVLAEVVQDVSGMAIWDRDKVVIKGIEIEIDRSISQKLYIRFERKSMKPEPFRRYRLPFRNVPGRIDPDDADPDISDLLTTEYIRETLDFFKVKYLVEDNRIKIDVEASLRNILAKVITIPYPPFPLF